MKTSIPYLTWGINKRVDIPGIKELISWINALSIEAQETGKPFSIQLHKDENTGLLFTVGLNYSHLEYYSVKGSPLIIGSRGSWDNNEEIITFIHGDEPSEMEKKYFIPIEDAIQGIQEYFLTGERPQNIKWGDNEND
jgi:hypothetical protein